MPTFLRFTLLSLALALPVACSSSESTTGDGTDGATTDGTVDDTLDASSDGGVDSPADSTADSGDDTAKDAPSDAPSDAHSDGTADAPGDAGTFWCGDAAKTTGAWCTAGQVCTRTYTTGGACLPCGDDAAACGTGFHCGGACCVRDVPAYSYACKTPASACTTAPSCATCGGSICSGGCPCESVSGDTVTCHCLAP